MRTAPSKQLRPGSSCRCFVTALHLPSFGECVGSIISCVSHPPRRNLSHLLSQTLNIRHQCQRQQAPRLHSCPQPSQWPWVLGQPWARLHFCRSTSQHRFERENGRVRANRLCEEKHLFRSTGRRHVLSLECGRQWFGRTWDLLRRDAVLLLAPEGRVHDADQRSGQVVLRHPRAQTGTRNQIARQSCLSLTSFE